MSDDLIRPHDPFSGHAEPSPADDAPEPEKEPEPAAPPERAPAKRTTRRGRRPRQVPTEAEVAEAARKVRKP